MSLDADARYTEKNPRVLVAHARRAFLEHSPIRLAAATGPPIYRTCHYGPLLDVFAIDLRTYRGPNTANAQASPGAETVHAGAQQLAWLKRSLRSSRAAWKVIASDMPIGLT
ncbi:alkaline phosphatase D family protein, partial [Pseudomonas sp. SCPG-7]